MQRSRNKSRVLNQIRKDGMWMRYLKTVVNLENVSKTYMIASDFLKVSA